MAEWLKVLILGLVEGLTEFIPVSSTGHLILVSDALQLRPSLQGVFEVFIQLGAVIAILVFYRRQLLEQARQILSNRTIQYLWLGVFVAFLPAAVLGLLLDDWIDFALFAPIPVAIDLIVGAVLFLAMEYRLRNRQTPPEQVETHPPTLKQALVVGIFQVLSLLPGMSRAGMSILGGMVSGLDRSRATQFSFYLALPTLGAASLYKLIKNLDTVQGDDLLMLMLGLVVAGVVSWLTIRWLLRYVATHNFVPFAIYRIILGIAILFIVMLPK